MQQLSEEFVNKCTIEHGYRNRGTAMTRIEVFVDAAFAFAITMLVISIDQIPNSVPALIEVSKQIPAFALSAMNLMWIWQTHSIWSRRFGLEDGKTVLMSAILVILVLIYVYPLRMLYSALFAWLTDNFLPSQFTLQSFDELRYLFAFAAVAFISISLIFAWMYQHVLNLREPLRLSEDETYQATTYVYIRWAIVSIGLFALAIPFLVPDRWVPFTGFAYILIGIFYPLIRHRRAKIWESRLLEIGAG